MSADYTPPVRKAGTKDAKRLSNGRLVYVALRDAGYEGLSVKEMCEELSLSVHDVLEGVQVCRDKGVGVTALNDVTAVRFALTLTYVPKPPEPLDPPAPAS